MSAEFLENLRKLAIAAASGKAAPVPGPAELTRQRVTAWLDAHHTPSRQELEGLRAAIHAAVLEVGNLDGLAKAGAGLAEQCQIALAGALATDQTSNALIGLLVKYQAAVKNQRVSLDGMRSAAETALGAFPKAGKKGGARFRGGKAGVN